MKKTIHFAEGTHKKGGMNADPPEGYVPAKPRSFKEMVNKMATNDVPVEIKLAQALVVIAALKFELDSERAMHQRAKDALINTSSKPNFIARLLGLS